MGCRGIHVSGHTACLAHLDDADRDAYLATLTPGSDVDHRGTPFTEPLLNALLDTLREPATGHPHLGHAEFESATFQGDAPFWSATFQGHARFDSATFHGNARFGQVTFQGNAVFTSATIQGWALFELATFHGVALFDSTTFQSAALFGLVTFRDGVLFTSATFQNHVLFGSTTFHEHAGFGSATFHGDAGFNPTTQGPTTTFQRNAVFTSATFHGDARFELVVFERLVNLGPLVCSGRVQLSGAVFSGPVTLSFAARRLECRRTRWSSTAELRLRYATVDFSHAVFEYPLTIAAEAAPFALPDGQPVAEQTMAGTPDTTVRVASLRGVDAAHLVLADVDLSVCMFAGTVHLDQIRLEGTCPFKRVPSRTYWRRWRPIRFTQRRALAEEHLWRASQPTAVPGWNVAVSGAVRVGPAQLAPVYRALRKAFEDGKNEPGAADFYYGEMEMRRHDRTGTTRAERGLLHGY